MRLIAGILLAVLFACACPQTFAQTASSAIQGKVLTDAGAADGATVVLLNKRDSSVVKSTISGQTGLFYFDQLKDGSYLIFITKLNYGKTYTGPYDIVSGKGKDIGSIVLKPAENQLKEVSIKGKKDFAEVKADKTVLNVEQNIIAAGASLYDLLSSSPGVKVVNDDILYRGGQKALIAINGKPVLLTGDELVNFLKNYQSSSISQIELIENPGAKYGASGGGGMINIILKKKREIGSNISISESGAYGDRYKLNSGINYSLRTEKLNLFASYGFQDNKITKTIFNNRNIVDSGNLYNFNLHYHANLKNINNNFSAGGDYQIAKGHDIGFLVSGFNNDITIEKLNTTIETTNRKRDSSIVAQSVIHRHIKDLTYNLNYKANLDQAGNSVLSADGDYSSYQRRSTEFLENDFLNASGQPDSKPVFYLINSPSQITIKSANLDFKQTISKSAYFEAGVKSSRVNSDNKIDFEQQITGGYVRITNLTDHFIYHERIDAGYMQFNGKFDKTDLTVSLRDERTTTSTLSIKPGGQEISDNKTYNSIFPSVQINQDLGTDNQLTAFYTRSIQRPNYQDLNPFIGYVDQFYYSTGNPFLKPEYINRFEISDFFAKKYKVSLSMVVTDNFYSTIFQQNDSTKVYINIKSNIGTRYQYLLDFNIPIDLANWWNISADISAFHERYAYYDHTLPGKNTNGVNIYVNHNFKMTSKLSAQIYNAYESPSYYVISQYQFLSYTNAGLSYAILHNKGTIKLAVTDIFNSNFNKYQTNYANLNIFARDKQGSRFVIGTFTYRFGNSSSKGRNNATDEQKRLGSSSNEN